ncbi:hypothetical protein LOD99_5908 [Oopsacas minuta]|uniref:Uncharacterized protein n=1 Tax=Oopsacas minuta TaxID=111878 RepID=A0AAV7JQ69_9METZ|nr:hypothetical protein LOD99_5908 [Oopsacas minuta]
MHRPCRRRTRRQLKQRNKDPYEVRSRSPWKSKDNDDDDSDSEIEFKFMKDDHMRYNSNSSNLSEYSTMKEFNNCYNHLQFPKIFEKKIAIERLFRTLPSTDITDRYSYARVSVDWSEKHLQIVPGANLLATCKNFECEFFLKDVICPRGLYPERNGYCPMDGEIYRIKCPICKQRITPDASIGIGFFRCVFKVSYMLRASKGRTVELKAAGDTLVFAKCSKFTNELFLYLDINVDPIV